MKGQDIHAPIHPQVFLHSPMIAGHSRSSLWDGFTILPLHDHPFLFNRSHHAPWRPYFLDLCDAFVNFGHPWVYRWAIMPLSGCLRVRTSVAGPGDPVHTSHFSLCTAVVPVSLYRTNH